MISFRPFSVAGEMLFHIAALSMGMAIWWPVVMWMLVQERKT
jgi:hypothetical protein